MDYSLNIVTLEKKIRFYHGDTVNLIERIPENLINELWWSEKHQNKATTEALNEIKSLVNLLHITPLEAKEKLFGLKSISK